MLSQWFIWVCLLAAAMPLALGAEEYQPTIAEASGEAERAIAGFKLPEGMQASVWAAEPLLANPVAFKLDERGRAYVCETFRQERGVEDNRSHMNWLLDDLAAQTLDDRLAYFQKHLGDKLANYEKEHDRIRLIEDRDGDGRAETATVFADGFNGPLDGTGAGVLARGGDVFYTCIPNVWRLNDVDGDGKSDVREAMSTGYGIRVAFRGHDSHGLVMGPDGRLYFSIGDRGYNITTAEGNKLVRPYCGAVFRCEPDGSNLEEYCYGLRNPQELAFDNYGNLFTGDNNSDSGDRARWVYVTPQSDAGWRMYYQYLSDRGPFNREKLWHPQHAGQPAYIVPPIANFADGPSGLVHYPGVGLPERYRDHFFLCDFRGGPANSGVRSFGLKPKGAGFEMVDAHEFIWRILCTDIDFDMQGRVYLSDWVNGWNGLGKGRIYRFDDPAHKLDPHIAKAAKELAAGFDKLEVARLVELLAHPDQRIRQEAQFALVEKNAGDELLKVATQTGNEKLLARLHAIWGLGQLGRQDHGYLAPIVALLEDPHVEVRSQTLKVLADAEPLDDVVEKILALLNDENLRVRYFAALAIGRYGNADSIPALFEVLNVNADRDVFLRHAVAVALVAISRREGIEPLANAHDESPSVRRMCVVALRKLQSNRVAEYLDDAEPEIALEAARAIHDEPIDTAMPALAAMYDSKAIAGNDAVADALARRVANACFRTDNAEALIAMGTRDDIPVRHRLYALEALLDWRNPNPLERVLGDYRPLPQNRSTELVVRRLNAVAPVLLANLQTRNLGVKLVGEYKLDASAPAIVKYLDDPRQPRQIRAECVSALAQLKFSGLQAKLTAASEDSDSNVRVIARKMLAEKFPEGSLDVLLKALGAAELAEQQAAIASLVTLADEKAGDALVAQLDRLVAGEVPVGLQLDLLEAAQSKNDARFKERLEQFNAQRATTDPLAAFRECLEGGDAKRGEEIVFGRSEASCRRCHKVGEQGGEVGPNLTTIGKDKTREYLLEAVVLPSAKIAQGFESATIILDTGKIETGIVKSETDDELVLMKPDGELVPIAKGSIEERAPAQSAMPELVQHLTKRELRDVIEYLKSLQ
jgi:quinoprotein glucose dehydrogenase